MSLVDDMVTTNGIDLGSVIKLPSVDTEITLSKQAMIFVGAALTFVALMVFKPFSGRRRW